MQHSFGRPLHTRGGRSVVSAGPVLKSTHLPIIPSPPSSSSTQLRNKEQKTRITDENLPPAQSGNGGLVGNDNYTSYKPAGHQYKVQKGNRAYHSLPNSSTEKVADDEPSRSRSAPWRKRQRDKSPQRLPKINTLVKGKYDQDGNKGDKKVHAGLPTNRQQTKRTRDKTKFASSWAEARTGFVKREDDIKLTDREGDTRADEPRQTDGPAQEQIVPENNTVKGTVFHAKERVYTPIKHSPRGKAPRKTVITIQPKSFKPNLPTEARVRGNVNRAASQAVAPGVALYRAQRGRYNAPPGGLYVKKTAPAEEAPRDRKGARNKYERPWAVRTNTQTKIPPRRERLRTARMNRTRTQMSLAGKEQGETFIYTNEDAARLYAGRNKTHTSLSRADLKSRGKSAKAKGKEQTFINPYTDPLSKIPPWHRKEYMLTRREADMYRHISGVYGNHALKNSRKEKFLRQLEAVQIERWREQHDQENERRRRIMESKERQQWQLKNLRDRFEEERYRRYMSQYVTSRVLDYEWETRHFYGLPEDLNDDTRYASKLKRKKTNLKKTFDTEEQYKKNQKRYSKLFGYKGGPEWDKNKKPPKMEGIDTVDLGGNNDKPGRKNVAVKSIVGDAKKMLESDDEDDDDLSLDDEDSDEESDESPQPTYRRRHPGVLKERVRAPSKSPKRQPQPAKRVYIAAPSPVRPARERQPQQKRESKQSPTRLNKGRKTNVPAKSGANVRETGKGQYMIKRKKPNDGKQVPRAQAVTHYADVEPGKKPSNRYKDYKEMDDLDDIEIGQTSNDKENMYSKPYQRAPTKFGPSHTNPPQSSTRQVPVKKSPTMIDSEGISKQGTDPDKRKTGAKPSKEKSHPGTSEQKKEQDKSEPSGHRPNAEIDKESSLPGDTTKTDNKKDKNVAIPTTGRNNSYGSTKQENNTPKSPVASQHGSKKPSAEDNNRRNSDTNTNKPSGPSSPGTQPLTGAGLSNGNPTELEEPHVGTNDRVGSLNGSQDARGAKAPPDEEKSSPVTNGNEAPRAVSPGQRHNPDPDTDGDVSKDKRPDKERAGSPSRSQVGKRSSSSQTLNKRSPSSHTLNKRSPSSQTLNKRSPSSHTLNPATSSSHPAEKQGSQQEPPQRQVPQEENQNDKTPDPAKASKADSSLSNQTPKTNGQAPEEADKKGSDETTPIHSDPSTKDLHPNNKKADNNTPDRTHSANDNSKRPPAEDSEPLQNKERPSQQAVEPARKVSPPSQDIPKTREPSQVSRGKSNVKPNSREKSRVSDPKKGDEGTKTAPPPSKRVSTPNDTTKKKPAGTISQRKPAEPEAVGKAPSKGKGKPKNINPPPVIEEEGPYEPFKPKKKDKKKKKPKDDSTEKPRSRGKGAKSPLDLIKAQPSRSSPVPAYPSDPERRDIDSIDLASDDDDDIFERARRKYGIQLDSDDED